MGWRTLASTSLAAVALCCALPGCTAAYAEEDRAAEGTSALGARACANATLRTTDTFERTTATDEGWSKGRVSDADPVIKTLSSKARSATNSAVLSSRVAASTDDEGKTTAYIEREVQTMGCVAAEFSVAYSESAPFPDDAWTYFFWIDGSKDMNVSLFRQGNTVRLAAQRGGTELSRIDVEVPPGKWTKIKIEVELDSVRPSMSIAIGEQAAKQVTLAEPLPPPYYVSVGTWSRGKVPAHEFWFDNLKLWY